MGKSVSKGLKYRGQVLLKEYPDKFGLNYAQNAKHLNELPELGLSKHNRNIIAGYIVRLTKARDKQ